MIIPFFAAALYFLYKIFPCLAEIIVFLLTNISHILKLGVFNLVPVKKLTSRSRNASIILKLFSANFNNLLILKAPFSNFEINWHVTLELDQMQALSI